MPLNRKQQQFVQEYLIDLNASQAARRAGYSPKTCDRIGHENLNKLEIKEAIAKALAERSQRTNVTADRVLLEIAYIAFSDPRKVFDEHGHLKPVNEWSDSVAASIASIKTRTEYVPDGEGNKAPETVREIRFWDKNKALESAGRHLGIFNDKVKVDGDVNGNFTIKIVRQGYDDSNASK